MVVKSVYEDSNILISKEGVCSSGNGKMLLAE
jgi:hypothetical protein